MCHSFYFHFNPIDWNRRIVVIQLTLIRIRIQFTFLLLCTLKTFHLENQKIYSFLALFSLFLFTMIETQTNCIREVNVNCEFSHKQQKIKSYCCLSVQGFFFAEKQKERTVNRISVIDGHKYRLLLEVRTNWATSKYTLQKHSYDTVYALITMRIIYYRWLDYCNRIQFNHSTNLFRPKKVAQLNRSIIFFCHRTHR